MHVIFGLRVFRKVYDYEKKEKREYQNKINKYRI